MSGKTASQSRRTSPLMAVAVHGLVVPLPCATGDDGKPMRLLPCGGLSPAILPIVSRAARATSGGDDLGGGILGKLRCEGHGQTIHGKNKSAMPKIVLAIRRQCRHITCMSNTNRTMIIEAPITEQVRELHANDLASALLVHGICKPGQAASMVAADRAKCERLIIESIANENR